MTAEAKVTIVNKSASLATITYTNWTGLTSRSIVVPAGSSLTSYNWHEPNDLSVETSVSENIFNLPIQDGNPLTKTLISDFGYDKDRVSVTLTAGSYSE